MTLAKPKLPILQRGHQLARGLVGAWLMYEGAGSGTRDSARVGHGSFDGAITWARGADGALLSFPGTARVIAGNTGFLPVYTMAAVGTATTADNAYRAIIARGGIVANDTNYYMGLRNRNNAGDFRLVIGHRNGSTTYWNEFRLPEDPRNARHTYAGGYNGSAFFAYYDGMPLTKAAQSGGTDPAAGPTDGGQNTTLGSPTTTNISDAVHVGTLACVLLYNYPLPAQLIRQWHLDPYQAFRPPRAPLLAALTTDTTAAIVLLQWQDNSEDESGFRIERSTDGANFVEIDTVGAGVTSYQDAVSGGATYYYRVRAYSSNGNSDYSNVAEVTTT